MTSPGTTAAWRTIAGLPPELRERAVREALDGHAVAEPDRVAPVIARLLELPIFALAAERVVRALRRAGSPERAILALEDAVGALESSRGDASPLFIDPVLALLVELAGASGRAARMLASDPALAIELGARAELIEHGTRPAYEVALRRIVAAAGDDTAELDRGIRRLRNRSMLSIALRELREGDVRETSRELADLAAASMQAALDHHLPILEARFGRPDPPCEHVVIGMGKLGGRELNFSSDIDVMYFYEHDEGRAGELSLHELFVKLFERVTASIGRHTEHGFVFRVDLDLRPEGRSGPLANSLASAERYYETWGRTWERAAWIKGRPIAGGAGLGARVLEMIRPFVYRKSFDFAAIEEIFAMKTKIDAARTRAALGGEQGFDLKLGLGGIREIEFFVQAFQLLHGGRDPALRVQNTLEALQRLEAAGLVGARTREQLADAYSFLRKTEHRVQIVEDRQTHVMPAGAAAADPIARSLGFPDAAALAVVLAGHTKAVHEIFTGMVGAAQEKEAIPPEVEIACDADAPLEARLAILASVGARDPHVALENLARAAKHPRSPFHPHADATSREIGQRLLVECWASPSVDRAMKHMPDLIRSLISHGSYLSGLDRPALRRGVARVLGASDLLARYLVSNPSLIPHVLLEDELPSRGALERDLQVRLADAKGDLEVALIVLRNVKQEEVLRTAIADLSGTIDTETVNERLTTLAEVEIRAALELAEAEMTERYGRPRGPSSLAIVGGGTLGAREMGYRSDVDLSVIYDGDGETAGGERAPITCGELFTRVAQRMISFLTMQTPQGDLYPVDMRLRPSGNKGPLVASLENFTTYHRRTAQLWERQALVRARSIAGDPGLRARVDEAIAAAAYGAGPVEGAAKKIHEMRVRMQKERSAPRRRRFRSAAPGPELEEGPAPRLIDLKLGPGGLVEAEFLVQHLLIQEGGKHYGVRTTSTRRALAALGQAGILPEARAERLVRAYDRLRKLQNWLRIAHDEMIDHVDLAPEVLRPLALAIGYQGDSAERLLERDLLSDTAAIHLCYTEVLGAT